MEPPAVQVGDLVLYAEPDGTDRQALVTAVWSPTCINVVFVDGDASKQDQYGRQIKRATSVSWAHTAGQVHGFNWRLPGEEKVYYKPPLQS